MRSLVMARYISPLVLSGLLVACTGEIDAQSGHAGSTSTETGGGGASPTTSSTTKATSGQGGTATVGTGATGGTTGASGGTTGAGGAGSTGTGSAGTSGLAGSAGKGGAGGTNGVGGAGKDAGARTDGSGGVRLDAAADAAAVGCGKRGFASVLAISSAPADLAALSAPVPGVSWFYSWAKAPSSQVGMSYVAAGVEWVPMVWGHPDELADNNLASKIQVGPGTKYLLGYNEPNFTAQSNLTPAQAAAAWPYLQTAADALGLQTVSPVVNFCGGGCNQTDPFVWLDQFLAACANCRIDYVAFHSYACDSNWFLNTYMTQAVDKYYTQGNPPRKIWLTEFACADAAPPGGWTTAQIQAYMNTVVPWLESQPAIFRYAWFGDTTGRPTGTYVTPSNALLAGAGQLTSVGTTYTTLGGVSCP